MSSFQTYIGSAFASYPVRWVESPEAARSRSAVDAVADKPVEKTVDPDAGKPQSASGDVLDISSEAEKVLEASESEKNQPSKSELVAADSPLNEKADSELSTEKTEKPVSGEDLTPEEQQQLEELKARDREVRVHEMAHVMAGGAYVTSGPSYTYQTGPDGKGYAIGGEVGIDTGAVEGDPKATIEKMQTVAAAALAPSEPSGQDLKVAAAARQALAKAQMELAQEQSPVAETEETQGATDFSIVRSADKAAETEPGMKAESGAESAEKASVWGKPSASVFGPSAAYKSQSIAALASTSFSAFA